MATVKAATPLLTLYRQASRYDPTNTTTLRNLFAREMGKRFRELKRVVKQAIVDEDCFGLLAPGASIRRIKVQQLTTPGIRRFDFPRSPDKVAAFMDWLLAQVEAGLLTLEQRPRLGAAIEEPWTNIYIKDSYERGVQRARSELIQAGYNVPPIDATGGLFAAMTQPFHADRLGVLYTRCFDGLKGITAAMDTQISQILAQGIADGDDPYTLARKLLATIDGTGMDTLAITDSLGRFIPAERRAKMLARTEIIRAHHQATVQEYENWGVLGVVVNVEWRTAGYNVCPLCASLEGREFTLAQIKGMIPMHPHCRCCAVPKPLPGSKAAREVAVRAKKGAEPPPPSPDETVPRFAKSLVTAPEELSAEFEVDFFLDKGAASLPYIDDLAYELQRLRDTYHINLADDVSSVTIFKQAPGGVQKVLGEWLPDTKELRLYGKAPIGPDVVTLGDAKSTTVTVRSILRHELGHAFYSTLPPELVVEWESLATSLGRGSISLYADSSVSELFSECFRAYTSASYGAVGTSKLPASVEQFLNKALATGVRQRSAVGADLIAGFPEKLEDIPYSLLMRQAKLADIEAQIKLDLSEITGGKQATRVPIKNIRDITTNMKNELSLYSNYLAGDTALLMRDLIDDFGDILRDLEETRFDYLWKRVRILSDLGIDLIRKLIYQEVESNRRQFTDHGIRHLVNNWKMADRVLELLEQNDPFNRLKAMFIMVNHDIGYTVPIIRAGGLRGVLASKYHKEFSEAILTPLKKVWDEGKVFVERDWKLIMDLIRTHDSFELVVQTGKNEISGLHSAIRMADNLSQFWSEKLPSMFRYVDGSREVLVEMMDASAKKDIERFETLRDKLRGLVSKSSLSEALKRDLLAGVDDINYLTPKFALPTLAGEVSRLYGSTRAAVVIEVRHNEFDAFLQQMFDLGQKRVKSLLEDLGFTDFSRTYYQIGKLPDGRHLLEIRVLGAPSSGQVSDLISFSNFQYKLLRTAQGEVNAFEVLNSKGEHIVTLKTGSGYFDDLVDFANKHHMSIEEALEHIVTRVKELTAEDKCDIWIRRHSRSVGKILKDGGMKNQYDAGTSSGMFDPGRRMDVEQRVFGCPQDLSPSHRPIYGYLASDEYGRGSVVGSRPFLEQYGDVAFKLKKDVRSRTTFCFGDSLDDHYRHIWRYDTYLGLPAPLNSPSFFVHADVFKIIDRMKTINDYCLRPVAYGNFVETQVWGGVRLSDIEEVVFFRRPPDFDLYKEEFEKLGIKVTLKDTLL